MAKFMKYNAKKQDDTAGKRRSVFFTCHPADFSPYFEEICNAILASHAPDIYYKENPAEIVPDAEKPTDLGRFDLFVVPVTYRLLSEPNTAMDDDLLYAFQEGIPVLPIMLEGCLDDDYAQRFGSRHYLNPYDMDPTARSYQEKLKTFLDLVLISDEMVQRISAAFAAKIFLSYRKKDRQYANQLMQMIHSNPECRDIAIWFDEFLTPGEDFESGIADQLDQCDLFTLLVTPHLFEQVANKSGELVNNYVLSTELPMAQDMQAKKGTDILAVEMQETDRQALEQIQLSDCVNGYDQEFRDRLVETVTKLALKQNDTPEHTFLIGLAYLKGIDMEIDREKGLQLITTAAEAELPEAMVYLRDMYGDYRSPHRNGEQALVWAQRVVDYYATRIGSTDERFISALAGLYSAYRHLGELRKALELAQEVYRLRQDTQGNDAKDTLVALLNLAGIHRAMGDPENTKIALTLYEEAYARMKLALGENDGTTLTALNEIAAFQRELNNVEESAKWSKKAYDALRQVRGEQDFLTLVALNNLVLAYSEIPELQQEAIAYGDALCDLCCKAHLEETPFFLSALNNRALAYSSAGHYDKAIPQFEDTYERLRTKLGECHPYTISTLYNLAATYSYVDWDKFLELEEQVYRIYREHRGAQHPLTLEALREAAEYAYDLQRPDKAVELATALLDTAEKESSYYYGAMVYLERARKMQEACQAAEQAKATYEQLKEVNGEKDLNTLNALRQLMICLANCGNIPDAITYGHRLYDLCAETFGKTHLTTIADLHYLATLYGNSNRNAEAATLFESCYHLLQEATGKKDPCQLTVLCDLAEIYSRLDQEQHLKWREEAYLLSRDALGEQNTTTISLLENLITLQRKQGKLDDDTFLAETERIYQLYRKTLGEDDLETISALHKAADHQQKLGRLDKALELYEELHALEQKQRTCSMRTLDSLALADLCREAAYYRQGKAMPPEPEDAFAALWKALAEMECDEQRPLDPVATLKKALLHANSGDNYPQALPLLCLGYEQVQTEWGEQHPLTILVLRCIIRLYYTMDGEQHLKLQEQLYQLLCDTLGVSHPDTIRVLMEMAAYCYKFRPDLVHGACQRLRDAVEDGSPEAAYADRLLALLQKEA